MYKEHISKYIKVGINKLVIDHVRLEIVFLKIVLFPLSYFF